MRTSTKSTDTLGFATSGRMSAAGAAACAGAPRLPPAALPGADAAFAGAAALALPTLGGLAAPVDATLLFAAGTAEPLDAALPLMRRPSELPCDRCPETTASRVPLAPAAGEPPVATAGAFVDSLRAAGAGPCLPPSAGGGLLAAAPALTLRGAVADAGTLPAEVLRGNAPFAGGLLLRASTAGFGVTASAVFAAPFTADAVVPAVETCDTSAASLFSAASSMDMTNGCPTCMSDRCRAQQITTGQKCVPSTLGGGCTRCSLAAPIWSHAWLVTGGDGSGKAEPGTAETASTPYGSVSSLHCRERGGSPGRDRG